MSPRVTDDSVDLLSEYSELCADWRHRDGMLWQSLAVSITVTGFMLGAVLSPEPATWYTGLVRAALFFLAFLLNSTVILKIVKDHNYQLGSAQLITRLHADVIDRLGCGPAECLRITRPATTYTDSKLDSWRLRSVYDWLADQSTFRLFFGIQFFLWLASGIGFIVCAAIALS